MKAKSIDKALCKALVVIFTGVILLFGYAGIVSAGESAICIGLLLILNEISDICREITYKDL